MPAEEVTARVLDAAARHQLLAGPTFSVSAVKVAPNQATADDDTVGGDDGAGQNANGGTPNGYGQGGGAFGSLAVVALALVAAAVVTFTLCCQGPLLLKRRYTTVAATAAAFNFQVVPSRVFGANEKITLAGISTKTARSSTKVTFT